MSVAASARAPALLSMPAGGMPLTDACMNNAPTGLGQSRYGLFNHLSTASRALISADPLFSLQQELIRQLTRIRNTLRDNPTVNANLLNAMTRDLQILKNRIVVAELKAL